MSAEGDFRVIVVGAGISGLFMAEKLKRAGIDFTVYEKADEVGGTWRDNTYPGLYVDVLSRQYEFPFQPNYDWSRKFAPQAEIQAYIKKVAKERDLRKYIRFKTEIAEARFTDGRWRITTTTGETDTADVYVAATVIGIIPGTVVFSSVGNGLGAIFDQGGTPDAGILLRFEVLGPLLGLAALALLPAAYKKLRARRAAA